MKMDICQIRTTSASQSPIKQEWDVNPKMAGDDRDDERIVPVVKDRRGIPLITTAHFIGLDSEEHGL
ncbi:hypothetical protein TM48_03871 [Mycobacterium shottsii]|uniref:Uncharacterized protein n=1 Tax=Mycobacterium shottsii TaxID=133549 RepID=A0A7I7LI38_9MYCO|nr:hypothetical protein [Mycobacterium shottsii]QYL29396.1 hypothetical protein TM48_03871 [Mycobacterium shottsii]BBX59681.1 hypothetical protein MSHO_50260 [Mycobacterium shottsii]